jgi:hypothetical protein
MVSPVLEVMMSRSILSVAILSTVVGLATVQPADALQQTTTPAPKGPPASFSSSAVERTYSGGAAVPSRRVQTRTETNGKEVVKETIETVGVDGKMRMAQETSTETVRTGANATQTKRDVYVPDAQGRPRLLETTQIDMQSLGAGSTRSVANTFTPDLNGRLGLAGREVQDVTTPSANVLQTNTTIYRPGTNDPLVESERLQRTERKVSNDLTQAESSRQVRDGNGKWQTAETRSEEVRTTPGQRVAEETVRRADVNGALSVSERRVTTQSKKNNQEETVTETYLQNTQAIVSAGNRLELSQRVRNVTAATADGGQQTIREVEERNPVDPKAPMRVIERTVDTVRRVGPDQWELQRQVFALDGNGRLVPVATEKGQATGK